MQAIPASCPQCETQYQLTPEQLTVANGKVRCGVCNTVFQAAPPVNIHKEPPTQALEKSSPKSSFVNSDDDLLLSDTGVRESFDKPSNFNTGEFSSSFTNLNKEDDFGISDELNNFDDDTPGFKEHIDEEEWASQLLSEEGLDANEIIKKETKKETKKEQPRKALGSDSDDFDFDFDGLDDSALSLSSDEESALGFGTSNTKNDMIRNIKAEPLVFQIFSTRSLLSTLGLSIIGTIAAIGICAQLFFFQIDTLSRTPTWRSLYTNVCGMIGCNLPEQYVLEDIKATNLTVKSHPHYHQALMVDAIIINHADIFQPFPNIELIFLNTDQEIVAARQFNPKEYLRGELADAGLMPNQQPIHIALEINDPSNNATGYYINLRY
jgi:predicted Zn finger-like uncharacterized protein